MTLKENQEKFAQAIETFIADEHQIDQLNQILNELNQDFEFKKIELFSNILNELLTSLSDLSRKELKQRVLMIRGFDYTI